ncbi:hypothetical protein AGMMS49574_07490 [Bacteroidia bacterium]|nr:hypothetical protein AGMMS49574_07490 [Bacteroidia bacterium]
MIQNNELYMKHFILSVLLLAVFAVNMEGQNPTICRLGFTYDISQSSHWGKGKPVVTKVFPYSSAEMAGVKVYDIIDAIEDIPVSELAVNDIPTLLNPAGKNSVVLTMTNLTDSAKRVSINKDCKRSDAITEDQLASAFSMYSVESTSERVFTCPFKTTVISDPVNFLRYKTFAFGPIDENNRKLEEAINAAIEKEFRKKGLTYNALNPDMIVETFYFYNKNPNFKGVSLVRVDNNQSAYRYDFMLNRIEKFPFLDNTVAESEAEYLLQLGVRLKDNRNGTGRILWECEANELMNGPFRLENYAQSHIPLMCMQYPYSKYTRNVQFLVSQKSYNYTGISYDVNHLEQVMDVDLNSPAHIAGLRVRDVIERIDTQPMNHTTEEYTAAYKQFITNTMSLRDPNTVFTDANGFKFCMFWDKFKYTQVADAIQSPRNMAIFGYLYKFAPYVSPSGNNACTFYIKRGKEKKEVVIRPTIHSEMTIEIK